MQYAILDVLVNTHLKLLPTGYQHPLSKNILNVLSAEYLEHNVILTAVCNGKYVQLETGGLPLSLTNHESLWKEA